MTYSTINGGKTIAGGGEGAILAGRYKAFRRPGLGGKNGVRLKMV